MESLRSVRAWRMPLVLLIFALNTAYLAAFASPTVFYFANVVFHMAAQNSSDWASDLTIRWFCPTSSLRL